MGHPLHLPHPRFLPYSGECFGFYPFSDLQAFPHFLVTSATVGDNDELSSRWQEERLPAF